MKKKILALCLVVALLATAIVGATLAYFTDTDSAKNVMTTGNVDIKQHEEERGYKDGKFYTMQDFVQNQKLYPLVDKKVDGDGFMTTAEVGVAGDETTPVFHKLDNTIDKFVSVTNVGSEPAYVRTILAFETNKIYEAGTNTPYNTGDAHSEYLLVNGNFDYLYNSGNEDSKPIDAVTITINGVTYRLAVCVYPAALAPEERSTTSLRQIALSSAAGNEIVDLFGETYDILVLSQATQTAGFASAEEALDEAFGEVNATTAEAWFKDIA